MNKVWLKIEGPALDYFFLRLAKEKIEIMQIKFLESHQALILVFLNDYEKIVSLKGIYEISIYKLLGVSAFTTKLKENLHLLVLLILSLVAILVISSFVFEVDISVEELALKEELTLKLETLGLKKGALKPKNLENIKNQILKESEDTLEWLEIIPLGTKYVIKAEKRVKNAIKGGLKPTNIVASKNGTVKKIIAESGKVVALKDNYVKKGDILITGAVTEDALIHAEGDVYAEVFYRVNVESPIHLYKEEPTSKVHHGLKLHFFKKNYPFYQTYRDSEIKETLLFKNDFLPIYLSYDEIVEYEKIDYIMTYDEALDLAIKKAREEIEKNLKINEKIISEKQLKVELKDSKILLEILFTTYENIATSVEIEVEDVPRNFEDRNQ